MPKEQRPTVAYITAASHSGKSASVVLGFLRCRQLQTLDGQRSPFTHYLYMPFRNNGGNYHSCVDEEELMSTCGRNVKLREALGAMYMRDCFKAEAFGQRDSGCCEPVYIDVWNYSRQIESFKRTQALLKNDVSEFMRRSPNGVLLVHVDEHREMCPDPSFRKGALRVLAELANVKVFATYTDIPPLPAQSSSGTCRQAVACLMPDVKTIMEQRLQMPDGLDMGQEAVLLRVATLRVTLGLALQKLLLVGLHVEFSEVETLLKDLNGKLQESAERIDARLASCINLCNAKWIDDEAGNTKYLIDLLCGIRESDAEVQEQRYPQVVVLGNRLAAPLLVLLRGRDLKDPANMLHRRCQSLFLDVLSRSDTAVVTAGKVLEFAYLWSLGVKSNKYGEVRFGRLMVQFQCQDIEPGSIFEQSGMLNATKVEALKQKVLYYAEGNHPCADLFFKDASGVLYFVDVGGTSNMSKAENKSRKMKAVISRPGLGTVQGIVLLPNVFDCGRIDDDKSMRAVIGVEARQLLGGLVQLLTWLPDD
eukprot:TRINITY_DN6122_c0_g1_i2.p1 TRINITY_DN6122_c0_g1~~TRINITY_DN6122_c0_g1_i2.p1  ORF type:complete len:534 (+),score=97.69 TRINITY_DN6122_c0_g1_i2:3-1604(+)